jgi:sugar lactone lactonase YvrE
MVLLPWCGRAVVRPVAFVPALPSLQLIKSGILLSLPLLLWSALATAQSKVSTTTTLALATGSGPASSVPAGTVVSLTASVIPASGSIKAGQVKFCDATAATCTDVHLLGTAQVTSAGTAIIKLRPGIGSHSYKAVFAGTISDAGSSSSAATLTVTGTTGTFASATAIAETGGWGNYTLTATVTEAGGTIPPTGTVTFADTSNGNSVLNTATLGPGVAGVSWPNPQVLTGSLDLRSLVVGDFNGDGIPDLLVNAGNILTVLLGKADGTYTAAASLPSVPGPPVGVIAGDFNGDGNLDLAVTIYGSGEISILLGHGDGTFTLTAAGPALGSQVTQFAVGDFNGDGIPDLVLIDDLTGAVNILLGAGDGTFTAVSATPTITGLALYFAMGDFNGDGKLDLAVMESGGDLVSILLGNGDGTFAAASTVHCGSYTSPIVAGDFNRDGKLDLAVGFGGATESRDVVTILTGNGDGTFNSSASTPANTSNTASSIQVGDFNRDGFPDVVLTDSNGNAVVYLNNGSGALTESFPVVTISPPYYLVAAVGDLNGNGYSDIAAGGYYINTFSVFLTEPTETATASANISLPVPGKHLADAGYPGDANYQASTSGTLPLWGVPPATTTTLSLTAGGAPATSVARGTVVTLTATVTSGTTPVTAGQVNFCDASSTHCTDIHLLATVHLSSNGTAVYKFVPGPGQHSYQAVFVEDGAGLSSGSNVAGLTVGPANPPVYTDATSIAWGGQPGAYSLTATVEGFGGTAAPSGTVSFLDTSFGNAVLGTANLGTAIPGIGWLVSQSPTLPGMPVWALTGDFNGDGIADVAVLNTISTNGTSAVSICLGNGDGTFTLGPTTQAQTPGQTFGSMVVRDFNGDGKPDLALLGAGLVVGQNTVTTFLGNGDGTFTVSPPSTVLVPPQGGGNVGPGSLVAADFNGDGKLDVAVVGNYVSGGVSMLLGNGDGTFTAMASDLEPSHEFRFIAAGDFNGDGIPDLVVTDFLGNNTATLFLGKGDGTFVALPSFTYDNQPAANLDSITEGDFNGDGILDLAFSDVFGIHIFLGKGDGNFTASSQNPILVPMELYSLTTGDFNHDGKVDIAGLDNYNDRIELLLGAGDGTFTPTVTAPTVSQAFVGPFAIMAADFNGDGAPDLAMLTRGVQTATILMDVPTETVTATVTGIAPIGAGTHNVEASYPGDSHYPAGVSATVPLTAALKPVVFSPAPGTYTAVQTITLTESIPGATIYYLASGPVSTNGYVVYTGPITLGYGGVESISAYATETGYLTSNTTTAVYTLNFPPAATPTFLPAPGYYATQQAVTISDTTPGAQIYYTTNGTYPSSNSTLYTGPIPVSSSQTLVAITVANGYSFGPVARAQYYIGSSQTSFIYSLAGTGTYGYSGDKGPATLAQLDAPSGLVRDSAGNVYFSDFGNHMVREIAAGTGIITRIAGTGASGYSGDGGPAASAELGYPASLALDSQGNLFIADNGNQTIRRVNLASGTITTYAGSGSSSPAGDGGPATAAGLGYIGGIAIDASGNVFISEVSPPVIREVNGSTGIIGTVAGTGTTGYSGDGGPAASATFGQIYGMAFDVNGNLYLADGGDELVRKLTAVGGLITGNSIVSTVAGTPPAANTWPAGSYSGDGGPATSAHLNFPVDVAVDRSGNLYISDSSNSVIRLVSASSGIISTAVGNGPFCGSAGGDGGAATSAGLCYPRDITLDSSGNLYIADQEDNRVREAFAPAAPPSTQAAPPALSVAGGTYTSPQTVTMSASTPGSSIYVTVDGRLPSTTNNQGYSLPIGVAGTVTIEAAAVAPGYLPSSPVSDTYKILSFSPVISTVAGQGSFGFSATAGPALDARFSEPEGVAIDKAGNIYLSDTFNSVVWLISAATGNATLYAGTGVNGRGGDGGPATSAELYWPAGIALDSAGNLYIADFLNNVIREVNASTGVISTVAGVGGATAPGSSIGDGGPATSAYLQSPQAVAFDAADNLYIADFGHYAIREVSAKTGIITTVAGNGKDTFSGDGGPATSAGIQAPNSVAVDRAGNIYVGTTSRVRKVAAATGVITTVAGVGDIVGNTGDGGPATSAQINAEGLGLDSGGNLYISSWPAEIRKVDAKTGLITKVAGIGFYGFAGDGDAALVAELSGPSGMAFNSAGDLYFADTYNYRLRKVSFTPLQAATPVFSVAPGTYTAAQSISISDATTGAAIYYTSDGTTPTISSTLYSGPITVSSSETIKAIAAASNYNLSAVATAAYVIGGQAGVPSLTSLSPAFTSAGSATFTLTVNGSGFTGASSIVWGSSALTTQFVSATQLTAPVPASDIAAAGVASLTVQTPAPGGGTSNTLKFEIDTAGSGTPPSFSSSSVTVTAGGTATYPVALPSTASNVSVICLNMPAGAACNYSPSAGTLNITTSSSTPTGTYQITSVFTETLPGAAAALTLLGLLLFPVARVRKRRARQYILVLLGLVIAVFAVGSGCGGGGGSTTTPPPQTHQVTSSGTVTLIVK